MDSLVNGIACCLSFLLPFCGPYQFGTRISRGSSLCQLQLECDLLASKVILDCQHAYSFNQYNWIFLSKYRCSKYFLRTQLLLGKLLLGNLFRAVRGYIGKPQWENLVRPNFKLFVNHGRRDSIKPRYNLSLGPRRFL